MKKKNQFKFRHAKISKAKLGQIAGGANVKDTSIVTGGIEPDGSEWRDYIPEQATAAV